MEKNVNGDLLSPWAYFGYNILFNIPIVGFILLIIFSKVSPLKNVKAMA